MTDNDERDKRESKYLWIVVGATAAVVIALLAITTGHGAETGTLLIVVAAGFGYLLPTISATMRGNRNVGAVAVVNVFLGWTFIGWVVALAMAAGGSVEGR